MKDEMQVLVEDLECIDAAIVIAQKYHFVKDELSNLANAIKYRIRVLEQKDK